MTAIAPITGAPSGLGPQWKSIQWKPIYAHVHRLQVRIAQAVKQKRWNKVKALQRILVHSCSARLLAVKKVTSRKGARTPGIDGQVWNTPAKKMRGALSLKCQGYKAKPLRRKLIPKKNGKTRALGIPCIGDRAMQALWLLALEPVAETLADPNSYGFRPYRACRDAIGQCFCALAKKHSPTWVLDADIKACFDWIDHDWLLEHIPINRRILKQWLKCGYFQDRKLFPTRAGTPQGGIISPCLANMTLDGLETVVKSVSNRRRDKVNFVRYADDFIVTASSKEHLELRVIPAISAFLEERGLLLSPEKTKIVRIEDGFDFLGQNLRKTKMKLLTTPSKASRLSLKEKVKSVIKKGRGHKTEIMIRKLNPIIRGWAQYHRFGQSGQTFWRLHDMIHFSLFKWVKRRNGRKTPKWLRNHFWGCSHDGKHFACSIKAPHSETLELINLPDIPLARYIKIKGLANPYDPVYKSYFELRRKSKNLTLLKTIRLDAGLFSMRGFQEA